MQEKLRADDASIEAVLVWALHCDHREVVDYYMSHIDPIKIKDPSFAVRLMIHTSRAVGTNLSFTDKVNIFALLNTLNEIEEACRDTVDNVGDNEWSYWKREVILQGAMNILYGHLFPKLDGLEEPPPKPEFQNDDISVPANFKAKVYLSEVENFFNKHIKYYEMKDEDTAKLFEAHVNSFTTEIFEKARGSKYSVKKRKLMYLFKNNDWETKQEHFMDFLDRIAHSIFPRPKLVLSYEGKKPYEESKAAAQALQEMAEANWNDARAHAEGPYARLPENSFSSPQKSRASETQPPKGKKAKLEQLKNLKRKYDEQDPLPEALAHSESTKLFASKAATAEKQPITSPLIPSSKKKKVTSTPAATSSKEPATDRQRNMLLAAAQLTVSASGRKEYLNDVEEVHDEEDDDIEEVEDDDDSEDNIRHAMEGLNRASESVQKKLRRPRKSIKSQLGSPLVGYRSAGESTSRHRHAWTEEEDQALLDGIKIHDAGNWRTILEDPRFGETLKRRTNVNLKDRYRTLIKAGRI